jgi:pimeloyl-ACP methyl ester carboxylesterase
MTRLTRLTRRTSGLLSIGAATALAVGAALAVPAFASQGTASAAASTAGREAKPTVVLVHGAFADSSSWNAVIKRLTHDGYPVRTVANPLRGLPTDTAAAKDVLRSVHGPVILVGHSYGGAVITEAAAGDPEVRALVYLAALAPDTGETASGPSDIPVEHPLPPLPSEQVTTVAADGSESVDVYLRQDRFAERFAADVDPQTAAEMAVTQRPLDAGATRTEVTAAAWHDIPSYYLTAANDRTIEPEKERWFARRIHAHAEEVDSSHAVMVSHPGAVTRLIEEAAREQD